MFFKKETPDPAAYTKAKRDLDLIYEQMFSELRDRVSALESQLANRKGASTLHKVEAFNGEEATVKEETSLRMTYGDKLASMLNAIKILPPNRIVNGRHSPSDIGAICGFIVTQEMLDDVYSSYEHEEAV
jgi:chitinase